LTHGTFTLFAWLAMSSAFAAIPMTYLAYRLESRVDPLGMLMQGGLQLVATLLFVAITLMLKRFLNRVFAFHDTDKSIDVLVMANVVAGVLLIAGSCYPEIRETVGPAALVLMVFAGGVQIQFGYKLTKLQNNLGGLRAPFCYLNMATGVCIASIVLMLAGVVLSAISDLMLATIFFTIAKELKEAERSRSETKGGES